MRLAPWHRPGLSLGVTGKVLGQRSGRWSSHWEDTWLCDLSSSVILTNKHWICLQVPHSLKAHFGFLFFKVSLILRD